MTPCTQNAKLFISRADLMDQLAWFLILERALVVYDGDNGGEKIMCKKLNGVSTHAAARRQ